MPTIRKLLGKIKFIIHITLISLIKIYRNLISPFFGNNCRFYPSCSLYAQIAIERFGVCYGVWLTVKRILRCNPWCDDGYDPVPESKYDR